jgi:hypothetical protein
MVTPARAAESKPDAKTDLAKATLLVYQGKQVCKYHTEDFFFFEEQVWGCEFITRFTCTATVVDKDDQGDYEGLTAGHCFNYAAVDKGQYYVADTLADKPVLHKIKLHKFANDERYDYALFAFQSLEVYPAIPVAMVVEPKANDAVTNINFALGLVKQTTHGLVVSGIIDAPAVEDLKNTKGRFLVSIGIGPGASGSAVIDDSGKIIGIVEAVFPGTQMPTVVMPTGKTFKDFIQDDSAGLRPLPPGPLPKPPAPPAEPTAWQLFKQLLGHLAFWK